MGMRTPALELKTLRESNPLKSRILVRRLAVLESNKYKSYYYYYYYYYYYWQRCEANTHGAAAKVMNRQLGEKGKPWHCWEGKSRLTGVPRRFLCQQT